MNWQEGRQGTGYQKLALAKGRTWDLYLLKYPPGSYVPCHTDPVAEGLKHWRANLRLTGEDRFWGVARLRLGRLIVLRPDEDLHMVKKVSKTRYVLSFGWLTKC